MTAQTDIYALGCILYEMVAGQSAVRGQSLAALEHAHCEGHVRPLPSDIPESIEEVIECCLAKDPSTK